LDGKKTQDSNGSNLQMLYKIEIPKNVVIASRVFSEYADEKGLITASEPGWCRRTACYRSKRKNQFQYAPSAMRAEWEKTMFLIFFLNNQIGATIIRSEFDADVNDTEVFDESQENNGCNGISSEDWNQRLERRLRKSSSENEKLRQETVLQKKLRKFSTKQQESEENFGRWKERAFFIFAIITTGLGTYFGTNSSC